MSATGDDSRIVRYYAGRGVDDRGRALAEVQAFDVEKMESVHDFIQWLFPLRQSSQFNPGAPVLTDADVRAFHDRGDLRENLRGSFRVFLGFLGLEWTEGEVREVPGLEARRWPLDEPNHNWLRITRVLLCLHVLGLVDECQAFYAYLKRIHDRPGRVDDHTFAYWTDAARGVAR